MPARSYRTDRLSSRAVLVRSLVHRGFRLARIGANIVAAIATIAAIATHAPAIRAPGGNASGNAVPISSAAAQTYRLTTIATFSGTNGKNPETRLAMDDSGNLYGTTESVGIGRPRTVFEIAAGAKTITTLATLDVPDVATYISDVILDSNGNLYGTTSRGGEGDKGIIFEIVKGTGTVTTLATLNDTNSQTPYGGLALDDCGNLYGTTMSGGASHAGTVFEIAAGTGVITTLASFNGDNGSLPQGDLTIDKSGNIYGTTFSGGVSRAGTVFKISVGSGMITTLAAFNGVINGSHPEAGVVIDGIGNLYGTTAFGGASNLGTVFEIEAGTGKFTTLVTFSGNGVNSNGRYPYGGLALDEYGSVLGTTEGGGANGTGTVFKIAAKTKEFTTIVTFDGIHGIGPIGMGPHAGLTLDGHGNLYGVTSDGGDDRAGTVFKLTPVQAIVPKLLVE